MLLSVLGLDVAYGASQVLWSVDLDVAEGEVVALIGSNGAGKTTLLSTVAGLLSPLSGRVTFAGQDITGRPAEEIAGLGISLVPQGRRLFAALTVRENLLMGSYLRREPAGVTADLERVYELFPRLKERENQLAGTLSGGEQQMCALARGLMAHPRLLLIDEMSLGLAPLLVEHLLSTIKDIRDAGITVLLVEQDVYGALENADRAYVLESGRIVLSGGARELLNDPRVRSAYLGM
ncbi:MAG: ABC transporter ATP-binding protein [Bacillota bacterium]|nr:ABC transporter ATP-binding protein [Bacillota bacterium]